jgi:hypothetical protein
MVEMKIENKAKMRNSEGKVKSMGFKLKDLYGKYKPHGVCFKCKKLVEMDDMNVYYDENGEKRYVCSKCMFKIKIRKSFRGW